MLKGAVLAISLALAAAPAPAQDRTIETLQARLFPVLSRRVAAHRAALAHDPALRRLAEARAARLAEAESYTPRPACILDRHMLSEADIATIDDALRRLAPSTDIGAWRRDAAAINRIIAVYGKGEAPRYPKIDGMALDPAAQDFPGLIATLDLVAQGEEPAAIAGPMGFALGLLDLNGRDEAARYGEAENASAFATARRIDWAKAPYSAIIVPGAGPEDARVALSAWGKLRLALAAARLLSAMHARAAKPALIVTDRWQSGYIDSDAFARRNQDELGYQPGRLGARISPTALPFTPSPDSLAVDPRDPLDP